MMLEKLNGFAEGKYDVSITGNDIATEYETKRTDAWSKIEELNITQRFVSTSKLVARCPYHRLISCPQQRWFTHIEPRRALEPPPHSAARPLLRPPLPRLSLRKLLRLRLAQTTILRHHLRTRLTPPQQPLRSSRRLPHRHRLSSPSPSQLRSTL